MSDDVLADRAERLLWADARKFIPESSGPLVALVPELVAELKTTRAQLRQVGRQLGLFLENGERIRVIVALAITDGTPEENR